MADKLGIEAAMELDTKQYDKSSKGTVKTSKITEDKITANQKKATLDRAKIIRRADKLRERAEEKILRRRIMINRAVERAEKAHQRKLTEIQRAADRKRRITGVTRGGAGGARLPLNNNFQYINTKDVRDKVVEEIISTFENKVFEVLGEEEKE